VFRQILVWWPGLFFLILLADQVSKQLASRHLPFQEPVFILPCFNLRLLYNPGAAFSFLAQAGGWQRWFLFSLSVAMSLFIVLWLRKLPPADLWTRLGLTCILAGAVGNLIDRLFYGYVIDFIELYCETAYFPAFNIADSAITVGALLLLMEMLWPRGRCEAC
jgi:signal peptidase II